MSYTENPSVGLAAQLYTTAVEAGLPHLLKYGGEFANADQFEHLGKTFTAAASGLIALDCVGMNENREWYSKEDNIAALSEEQVKKFEPLYNDLVEAHRAVLPDIENSGLFGYLDYFNSIHRPIDGFEADRETKIILTDDAKRSVISASLTLIEAVQTDPANATFVKGLAAEDVPALHAALADANYLMPEDAPENRGASIGEQSLRGTEEQHDAIINQAVLIAANIEIADSIQHGDRPMMAAAMLKQALTDPESTEVTIAQVQDPAAANPFNSDIQEEDGKSLLEMIAAARDISETAKIDPLDPENVLVEESQIDRITLALVDYRENNHHVTLNDKHFRAPGMSADSASAVGKLASRLQDLINRDGQIIDIKEGPTEEPFNLEAAKAQIRTHDVSGDEGGMTTESSYDTDGEEEEQEESYGGGGASTSSSAPRKDLDRSKTDRELLEQAADDKYQAQKQAHYNQLNSKVNELLPDEPKLVSVPSVIFAPVNAAVFNTTLEKSHLTIAKIANKDVSDLNVGMESGAFVNLQEAMKAGSNRSNVELHSDDYAMTQRRYEEMLKVGAVNDRVVKLDPAQGVLNGRGYKSPAAENAKQYVSNFIDGNLFLKDRPEKPDNAFRSYVREMAFRPVVGGGHPSESKAWKAAAMKMLAQEKEEHALRQEAKDEKAGVTFVNFDGKDVKKFTDIVIASGSKEPVRISIDQKGKATLSHPDGPTLSANAAKVSDTLANAKDSGRPMGSMIQVDRLRGAYHQSGEAGVDLMIVGENPRGFLAPNKTSRDEQAATKKATKGVKRFEDIALS